MKKLIPIILLALITFSCKHVAPVESALRQNDLTEIENLVEYDWDTTDYVCNKQYQIQLRDVLIIDSTKALIIGGSDFFFSNQLFAVYYDNGKWTEIDIHSIIPEERVYNAIRNLTLTDEGEILCYAYYSPDGHNYSTFIAEFEDYAFTKVVDIGEELFYPYEVYIVNRNEIYVATDKGRIGCYDGSKWSVETLPFFGEEVSDIMVKKIIKYNGKLFASVRMEYEEKKDRSWLCIKENGEWKVASTEEDYYSSDYNYGTNGFIISPDNVLFSMSHGAFKWNGTSFEQVLYANNNCHSISFINSRHYVAMISIGKEIFVKEEKYQLLDFRYGGGFLKLYPDKLIHIYAESIYDKDIENNICFSIGRLKQ